MTDEERSRTGPDTPVSAVIFDYGGVLRREDNADFDAFAATVGLPAGWLWSAFHDIPEYVASRTGRLDAAGYRAAVVRHLARVLPADRAEAALDAWEALRRQDHPVEPEMDAVLDRLRGRVRLGLLSNAGSGARRRLEELGVAARFDDVVCSGDVGLAKPDPAIFRLAASRLGLPPSDCAFVDDQERHVVAARGVGLRAHQHHRTRMAALLAFLAEVGALPPA